MVYLRYLIMANKPRIRFRGFTEDWEQRKLDDIAKIKTGGGTPKTANPEYWSGNIPWIQSSDLVEGDIVHVNINKFINNNALKNSAAKLISRDSIALVTRVGVGKVAVINQDFTTSQDFLSLSDFDGSDIKFLAYQLYRLMQENAKVLQGTSIKGITKTELIEQSISIPSSGQEQNLISAVLSKIDSIITLHQCKLKKLNLAKKSLLQKLFPRNGSQIPGVRFKGFTDAWEQRKLNDFGIATGGTSIESEFVDGGTYKVINIGSYSEESVYNDQGLRVNKTDKTKSRILNKYDLTMILNDKTASGNIIGRVLLIDQDNTYVYNQRTERIEVDTKDFLPMFLYHMLNAPEQRKYIVKASQGNTQIYVNWSTISNIDYMIPQLLLEQEKIANLFSLINKDITLHQRKLERLQEVKKGLLQKMFV